MWNAMHLVHYTCLVLLRAELLPFINIFTCFCRFAFQNVANLQPNKEYEFRIVAENFYGRSDPCENVISIKTEDTDSAKKKKQQEGICVLQEYLSNR